MRTSTTTQTRSIAPRRRRRWPLAIVAGGLLLAALALGAKGWLVYQAAQALRADLAPLLAFAAQPDMRQLDTLGPPLAHARAHAQALRDEAAPLLPAARRMGWLPWYGAEVAAAGDLLDLAADLTVASEEAYSALVPALQGADASQPAGTRLAARLQMAQPGLATAQAALARADAAWARLPLARFAPTARAPLERLGGLLPAARDAIDLALAAPELLGANGRQEYLLVAQNPDELRATGGLITAAGVLAFENGRLTEFGLADSGTQNDFAGKPYPAPPEPLERYMGLDMWGLQDANWSPDFPSAAQDIRALFRLGTGRDVPNVVAIDPQALRLLLEALGPLQVDGAAAPVGPANLADYLRNGGQAGAGDQPWWVQRKAPMAPLGQALIKRIEAGDVGWPALLGALRQAADGRHLQLAVQQPLAAAALERRGWDGAVQPGDADFLMLVDSNLGYNKVSPLVASAITYTADLADPNRPIGALELRQQSRAGGPDTCDQSYGYNQIVTATRYEELMTGCAWSYLRALVPEGSRLIAATANPTPGVWLLRGTPDDGLPAVRESDAGASEIGALVVIPPGQARRSFARYELPAWVLADDPRGRRYRLRLQPQAGVAPLPVTVRVRLPTGAALVSSSLPAASQSGQELTFQLTLERATTLELVFGSA